jgi:hypothetical protein
LPEQNQLNSPTYSEEQVDLFGQWVKRLGAVDGKELDLGVLISIHELVTADLNPSARSDGQ